ncbi:Organic solute transporter subunit alpha/Transmembrane protein 184 [Arabidopsis thaliana x Arabidopsis arenosa]|uniref:Organic solute transporter subunit alpha/Transmembrane protein 184 n=1 Tax=Arabidopsis thaliana x Arabidopsis arenosa TaxID=1240361 RepID=A0A8T2C6H9_9BRAS|nr:Organic solute transporter subunit alpha/Transmembrane protein 184 [Arabidopsis thaliana x Arabidopsis arenosa]
MRVTETSTYRDLHLPSLIIGGSFAAVAICLSLFSILQHLRFYTNPAEQKWIVSVLFMVPVYATESIISLSNSKFSLPCDILRNCYEAFALYSFGSYLVACLGGERRVVEYLENESKKPLLEEGANESKKKKKKSSFWKFLCDPYVLGRELFVIEKFGLVQYMILKTFCAFLTFLLELLGVYGDGEFKWYYGYPYIVVVLNFSQMWALFCLVQFYNVTHERLKEIKPLAKFISFKAIVFATWWQGFGIALLCYYGVLPKEGRFQNGLQDFLICIEMAIAAVAHLFVFPAEPYHYIPISECGKITAETSKTEVKLEEGGLVETTETQVEASGTSIKESVQDIVIDGGQHVVKDVVLTINQAMGPVEKGVTKIQDTIHQKLLDSDGKEETEVTEEVTVETSVPPKE